MADPDPRWQQLRAVFGAELDERVRELNRLLLHLERAPADDPTRGHTLDGLFRAAHSLKGAARAVELTEVEHLAHALESALDAARNAAALPAPGWFDTIYRVVDTFTPLYQAAMDGTELPPDLRAGPGGRDHRARVGRSQSGGATPADPPPTAVAALAAPTPVDSRPAATQGDSVAAVGMRDLLASAPAPAAAAPVAAARPVAETVRVAVDKLDALLAQAGELAVTDIRLEQRLGEVRELCAELRYLAPGMAPGTGPAYERGAAEPRPAHRRAGPRPGRAAALRGARRAADPGAAAAARERGRAVPPGHGPARAGEPGHRRRGDGRPPAARGDDSAGRSSGWCAT